MKGLSCTLICLLCSKMLWKNPLGRRRQKTKDRVRFSQCDIFKHFPLWKIHAESLFCNENWFYYIKFSPCSMMLIVFAKSSYYLLLLKFTFMWKNKKSFETKRVFFSSIIKKSNLIKFENWVEWKRFQVCSMTF